MIRPTNMHPRDWLKDIYIAKKLGVTLDDEGNEIVTYSTPVKYSFTINAVTSSAEIAEFGEKASITRRLVVPKQYDGEFNEFDLAYVDTTPEGESHNGDNADYRMLPPRVGNAIIFIYVEKILGK